MARWTLALIVGIAALYAVAYSAVHTYDAKMYPAPYVVLYVNPQSF